MGVVAVSGIQRFSRLLRRGVYRSTIPVAILIVALGLYGARRSDLFTVHVVEISGDSQITPVDSNEITRLADIPVGRISLFDLDFQKVERRIRSNSWVDSVRIEKTFPQTVSIHVQYRKPVALVQHEGHLYYVDSEGRRIEKMSLRFQSNLPVISGVQFGDAEYQKALGWIGGWKNMELSRWLDLDSIYYHPGDGYELWVRYHLSQNRTVRTRIHLGDGDISDEHWGRIAKVFEYLIQQQIRISDLHGDLGKKIVVKTSSGS